jgi:hypothetical protein
MNMPSSGAIRRKKNFGRKMKKRENSRAPSQKL